MKQRTNYHSGLAAEKVVADNYRRRGASIVARRWRGRSGEIDIVTRDSDGLVFIEVKKSKTHAMAAARVTRRQMQRIMGAALEFVAGEPKGQLTPMRFDVATVDEVGRVVIIENAFAA